MRTYSRRQHESASHDFCEFLRSSTLACTRHSWPHKFCDVRFTDSFALTCCNSAVLQKCWTLHVRCSTFALTSNECLQSCLFCFWFIFYFCILKLLTLQQWDHSQTSQEHILWGESQGHGLHYPYNRCTETFYWILRWWLVCLVTTKVRHLRRWWLKIAHHHIRQAVTFDWVPSRAPSSQKLCIHPWWIRSRSSIWTRIWMSSLPIDTSMIKFSWRSYQFFQCTVDWVLTHKNSTNCRYDLWCVWWDVKP